MYIWTALYLDDELTDLKKSILGISDALSVRCPVKLIPMHVSLKSSFDIKESLTDECIFEIRAYLSSQEPFFIEPECCEINPGILWLKMKDNDRLKEIHEGLDMIIAEKFSVLPSDLDKNFRFHTTVFTDTDDKLEAGLKELNKIKLPEKIRARYYLIGTSETGRPESYSVLKKYRLGPEVSIKEEWKKFEGDRPAIAEVK